MTLTRQWNTGDVISFTLPMDFKLTKYMGVEQDPKHEHYAMEYGPILMAYVSPDSQKEKLLLPVSEEILIKSLRQVPGKPLHFIINGNSGSVYMTCFEVQDETFTCFP